MTMLWWGVFAAFGVLGVAVAIMVAALLIEELRAEWARIEHDYWAWMERHRTSDDDSDDWPATEGRS